MTLELRSALLRSVDQIMADAELCTVEDEQELQDEGPLLIELARWSLGAHTGRRKLSEAG